ncbi:MAG: helix-turn-helix domain-containing protein [Pseudomonadota bacterium]
MQSSSNVPDLMSAADRCQDCPIRHRAVCSYSSPSELAELNAAKFYREYDLGQEIIGEGEQIPTLGSVISGVVALQKTMEDGRRQMVGLLFPSDFIGRPLRPRAPYDAVAVTPVRMCLFHRREFEGIMTRNQALERRLLEMTLDELDAARDWMLLLGRKTAQEKLATFLLILNKRAALSDSAASRLDIPIPLTREAIAEFLGLTIETVSRQFTALRKAGVIELPDKRSFKILRMEDLVDLSGDDGLSEASTAFA